MSAETLTLLLERGSLRKPQLRAMGLLDDAERLVREGLVEVERHGNSILYKPSTLGLITLLPPEKPLTPFAEKVLENAGDMVFALVRLSRPLDDRTLKALELLGWAWAEDPDGAVLATESPKVLQELLTRFTDIVEVKLYKLEVHRRE